PREEERRVERCPQLLPRAASPNRRIAVRAAREGIGLPVVTPSAPQSLLEPHRVYLEDSWQHVRRSADALRLAPPGERPRIGTRGPTRDHGKGLGPAHPPDGKRRISREQESVR